MCWIRAFYLNLNLNLANENIGHVEGSINEDHVENPSSTIPILQEDHEKK